MNFRELLYFGCNIAWMHLNKYYRCPLSMYIILTNRCNNKCLYCKTSDLPQRDILTTKFLKDILQDMYASGTRRLQFTGGEPMMREDLGEIIAYAKELGFFVGVSTNGYQIKERIDELKRANVIFLSYDGTDKAHSRLRGKNNLGEMKSALSALKKADVRVWISSVLTKENADYLDDIVDFARKNQVLVNFNRLEFILKKPHYLHPFVEDIRYLLLEENQKREVFQKLIKLKASGAPIGSSLGYLKTVLEWSCDDHITSSIASRRYKCWAGRAWGHLDFDGKLYPCGWEVLKNKTGRDVLKEGFRLAWRKLEPVDGCRSCSHACGVENNLIFSLNSSSIFNALRWLIFAKKVSF